MAEILLGWPITFCMIFILFRNSTWPLSTFWLAKITIHFLRNHMYDSILTWWKCSSKNLFCPLEMGITTGQSLNTRPYGEIFKVILLWNNRTIWNQTWLEYSLNGFLRNVWFFCQSENKHGGCHTHPHYMKNQVSRTGSN